MKKYISIISILLLLCIGIYLYLVKDFPTTAPTLYTNANIITLYDQQPAATAMLVRDGRIEAIGNASDISKDKTKDAIIVDLKGQTIMPGFIDPHTHFALSMFLGGMHDLSGFTHNTNQEVWDYFAEKVEQTPAGEWIIAKGIDPLLIHDLIPPSLTSLDKIAPNNPVLILSQSLHSYWVNSKAYELAGITKDTPNPSDHSYYERDENGDFTGLIAEQAAIQPFFKLIQKDFLTPEFLSNVSRQVMNEYASNGNTTIVSTGLTIDDEKPLILLQHLSAQHNTFLGGLLTKIGLLPPRKPTPRHFIYMRHDKAHLLPTVSSGDDFYDIIGVKHWYDGSPYIGSMYLDQPYQDSKLTNTTLSIPSGQRGEALIAPDSLRAFIKKYHTAGWQIAIHTQGDAAIREVLDVYEELSSELDFSRSMHRLEHCLLLPITELERMKKLNITPSFHINHLYYYGDALKNDLLGAERSEALLPIRATQDKGLLYSLHADQPMFPSTPFRLMQTAIERQTKSKDTIGITQAIELHDALRALTIDAARQIDMDDKIGSLEEGKYADFIILDRNPLEIPIADLEKIRCVQTFVNGNAISSW